MNSKRHCRSGTTSRSAINGGQDLTADPRSLDHTSADFRTINPYSSGALHCLLEFVLSYAPQRRVARLHAMLNSASPAGECSQSPPSVLKIKVTPIDAVIRNTLQSNHDISIRRTYDPWAAGALHSLLELALAYHSEDQVVELINLLAAPVKGMGVRRQGLKPAAS